MQFTGWHFTGSLDLLAKQFEPLKNKSTKQLCVHFIPINCAGDSLLLWNDISNINADVNDKVHQNKLQLRVTKAMTTRSKQIASDFNKLLQSDGDSNGVCGSSDEGSVDSLHDSEDENEGSDTDEKFEESLGDIAEDAERELPASGSSAVERAPKSSSGVYHTDTLSAVEVFASLQGEACDDDCDDADMLNVQECHQNEAAVDTVERKRVEAAINLNTLKMSCTGVGTAINELESTGAFQESATLEAALNSSRVMGNTNYDDETLDHRHARQGPFVANSFPKLCTLDLVSRYFSDSYFYIDI